MSFDSYELSQDAALTVLLHAAKFPSCRICGVLLGRAVPERRACELTSAVPLFHLSALYSPCVETALAQVEAHAAAKGLALLGYYHAEPRFNATDMHPTGRRIAERIAERRPGAAALLLDAPALAAMSRTGGSEPPLVLLARDTAGGGWRRVPHPGPPELIVSTGGWEALRPRFLNAHAAGLHTELADFDEHLDDVRRDYLNAGLLSHPSAELLSR